MKITTKQLRYLIKEELKKVLSEQSEMPEELEIEIFRMFDAGKQAAVEDGNDIQTAIRLAGEYALESEPIKEAFPKAHAWLLATEWPTVNQELENWMANKKYSMR